MKKVSWWGKNKIEISILIAGLIVINLIFIPKTFRDPPTIIASNAGLLGDFVGGFVGTFFTLVSIVLLIATLRSQRQSAQLVNFETKYFELLRMHRENVASLEVQGIKGAKLFVVLIRELRSALAITKEVALNHSINLEQREMLLIAYHCLFFGVGPNSSRILFNSLMAFDQVFIGNLIQTFENTSNKKKVQKAKKLTYVPFEGHQSRLGHYYRHLFQSIQYVNNQNIDIDKYEYVKTIRAQLSNHEQALLLVNSFSIMGSAWWKQSLITDYKLVKNIPYDFFDPDSELNIVQFFPEAYFEWR